MLLCYNHFIIHIVLTFPTKFFELGFACSSVRAGRLALSSLPITDNEFFFWKVPACSRVHERYIKFKARTSEAVDGI